MHTVIVNRNRPDYRVFVALLYGDHRNVDTEGDSHPPESRSWTDLYICDRESDDPHIEISASEGDLQVFEVESDSLRLEELAALYLHAYCGTEIRREGELLSNEVIDQLRDQYSGELLRAATSLWHGPDFDRLWRQREAEHADGR